MAEIVLLETTGPLDFPSPGYRKIYINPAGELRTVDEFGLDQIVTGGNFPGDYHVASSGSPFAASSLSSILCVDNDAFLDVSLPDTPPDGVSFMISHKKSGFDIAINAGGTNLVVPPTGGPGVASFAFFDATDRVGHWIFRSGVDIGFGTQDLWIPVNFVPHDLQSIATQDEGGSVDLLARTLNFVGAGVTASDAGSNVTDITIPDGGMFFTATLTPGVSPLPVPPLKASIVARVPVLSGGARLDLPPMGVARDGQEVSITDIGGTVSVGDPLRVKTGAGNFLELVSSGSLGPDITHDFTVPGIKIRLVYHASISTWMEMP